jgi:peptidoglycan/xylan/chitin deacetylase (PgdA/CDA1 family)
VNPPRPQPKPRIIAICGFIVLLISFAAFTPRLLPVLLAKLRPDITFAIPPSTGKILYLTIDDAPSSQTAAILAVLKKHDVPSTFFVMANRVTSNDQLQAITSSGHLLGNHLRTSQACSKLSLDQCQSDFDFCANLVEPATSARLFRPSSDFGTVDQIAYARTRGYTAMMGTVFPLDHWITSPRILTLLSEALATNGGILIMHDGAIRGATTAQVLDTLIPKLKASGYTFERIDQDARPTP